MYNLNFTIRKIDGRFYPTASNIFDQINKIKNPSTSEVFNLDIGVWIKRRGLNPLDNHH